MPSVGHLGREPGRQQRGRGERYLSSIVAADLGDMAATLVELAIVIAIDFAHVGGLDIASYRDV